MPSFNLPSTLPVEAAYRRFLRYYYLWNAGYDLIFAYAVYTVFFSLRGLSVVQIALLISWWSLTSILLEIPTGALADCWSRRALLAISPLIKALCFVTWYLADGHFYLYALGFLFWSLGSALVSGTEEALLYDTLAHHGRRQDYERVRGRASSYNYLAQAAGGIMGGVLASFGMEWAILLSVVPLLFTAYCARHFREVPKTEPARDIHYLQHIRLAARELYHSRLLRYLCIYLLGISIVGALEEFDQLYYQLVRLPLAAFGAVMCIGMLASALGARLAHRMKGKTAIFTGLPLLGALCLLLAWRFPSFAGIGLILIAYAVVTPVRILAESRIQHCITGASRATVTSAISFLIGGIGIGVPIVLGLIARVWNLPAIYFAGAIQLLVIALWVGGMRGRFEITKHGLPHID
jgi:MFS family permease